MPKKTNKPSPKKTKTAPKKNADAAPVNGDALYNFLLTQAGGQEAAIKAFAGERFRSMPKRMTLAEALDAADSEGWGALLRSMTLGTLQGNAAPSKGKARRKRGASEEARKAAMKVLSGSKGKPMSAREIADAAGLDRRPVARALGDLVSAGTVKRTGSKRDSRYSVA